MNYLNYLYAQLEYGHCQLNFERTYTPSSPENITETLSLALSCSIACFNCFRTSLPNTMNQRTNVIRADVISLSLHRFTRVFKTVRLPTATRHLWSSVFDWFYDCGFWVPRKNIDFIFTLPITSNHRSVGRGSIQLQGDSLGVSVRRPCNTIFVGNEKFFRWISHGNIVVCLDLAFSEKIL